MANHDVEGGTINQKSFVKAIVKYVLIALLRQLLSVKTLTPRSAPVLS
jgi:hypothetical protein